MENLYSKPMEDVYHLVDSSETGLSSGSVESRRTRYGFNELIAEKKESTFHIFITQFTDFLVVILLVAGLVSLLLGDWESAAVIFAVTVLNAILGTVQQIKAGNAIEKLKSLAAPLAKVHRDGKKIEIPAREVVVGDLLSLEAGDYICADGRLVHNSNLQVNESSLTGETGSVLKSTQDILADNVPLGDRKNMVFTGSLVAYGWATILVTHIGMATELGKIAAMLEAVKPKKTPLQVNLDTFGKKLAMAILFLCFLIFVLNIYRGYPLGESFLFAVALAVAAIPEALSSIVMIVLAIGTQKMVRENAIVRKLHAVESLGCVSVICSDKTGTLTQNKMVVERLWVNGQVHEAASLGEGMLQKRLLDMIVLCSDAVTHAGQSLGDPTEIALINLAAQYGIESVELRTRIPRIADIPFDSERKMMSTLHNYQGKRTLMTKGACDVMLTRATHIATDNGMRLLEPLDRDKITRVNMEFSQEGLRVLAVTYRFLGEEQVLDLQSENELIFLGLVAMEDPPRPESRQAVAECRMAGIRPVMITGDHGITATAIARQIGILTRDSEAIEGVMLDNLSDAQLQSRVDDISVYARVSPTHKIRIVKAWQQRGHLVAMTGDGVNDAPALSQADIGIAMGKVGTEVAKEAADIVLTDDNFATIVKAVSNGRSIYTNIKHSIFFLLSGNMAGILTVVWASASALPLPFTAVHLLFINLLTDSLPAIALGLEPPDKAVMKEAPRDGREAILTRRFLLDIFVQGGAIALVSSLAFLYGLQIAGEELGRTLAFATLTFSRLLHGFNCRSAQPFYRINLFSNKYVWLAFGVGTALLLSVLVFGPLQNIFKVSGYIVDHLHTVALLSLASVILVQLYKIINPKNSKAQSRHELTTKEEA